MEAQHKGTKYHIGLISRQQWSNNDSSPPISPPIIVTQSQIHTINTSIFGLSSAKRHLSTASGIATSSLLSEASRVYTPSHAATNNELQAAWRQFKKPVADEDVLPATIDLKGKSGQTQLGDRKISWKIDKDGLRTVQYEIQGTDGNTRHGGLKDQDNHDGMPETVFWYVDSDDSGFMWKRKIVHENGATEPRPWYLEHTQVCALTRHDPENREAIASVSGEGWATQVVPVDTADMHRLLRIATSQLPVTMPDGKQHAKCTKGDVEYFYQDNEHGTSGSFIGPNFHGHWTFHKPTEGPRSVFVSSFRPGEGSFGFGLQKEPGTAGISDGWFLPEAEHTHT